MPEDKREKWDAADAVAEGVNIASFLSSCLLHKHSTVEPIPHDNALDLDEDSSPISEDLISPRVLTPSGLLILGGAPKVGKSDFLLALLIHMALGLPFLGLTPPRPLRVFYFQAEIERDYMRERIQSLAFDRSLRPLLRQNLFITRQMKMLLDAQGIERAGATIMQRFPGNDNLIDIIAIDPLRNVFDGGDGDASENKNSSMMFFLKERIDVLRDRVNPKAGIILAHHTRKIQKQELIGDPFQALSGAGSLRGYYTSGMILFRPDETQTTRRVIFELRNGPHLKAKQVDKMKGQWCEVDENNERITNQKQGKKQDAERDRKGDIILQLLYDEARQGRLHTSNQFAGKFENKKGLGGEKTIRNRINVLADQGHIKFIKDGLSSLGYPHVRSAQGLLCAQDMEFKDTEGELHPLLPTHYKSEGALLPMENPTVWEVTKGEGEAQ